MSRTCYLAVTGLCKPRSEQRGAGVQYEAIGPCAVYFASDRQRGATRAEFSHLVASLQG